MALNDVTISLDLNQLLGGDIETRRTRVYVKTNVANNTLIDTSTGETRLGDERVTLEADGTGSFTTWGVGADGNPTSWQTSVVVEYPRAGSRDRATRTFGPYTITDADDGKTLAELEDQQAIPPNYQTAFTEQAQAYLDQQESLAGIDDTDSAVAYNVEFGTQTPAAVRELVAADVADSGSDIASALSASYGRTYRPEAYGAVGDGLADDTTAFEAMCAAVNAEPDVPAKVEFTRVYRIPAPTNGINFDAEDVDIYLAAGSRIFSEAASTTGGLLSCVGHFGLGTDTTPRRRSLYIHGPGTVEGWLGGPNENAIGVVRYETVVVDGPHVNAGHKGVTAQIGCLNVTVRNITSEECVHKVVTIEDQDALPVNALVENVRYGTVGEEAVLVSAAHAVIKGVKGDDAWTSNPGATNGAVHVTTTGTLAYAEVADIEIASVVKGVVVSSAQDFLVDNIRIAASTGNAAEAFNCASGGRVGTVIAPASPAAFAASGTTPAGKVRRLTGERNGLLSGEATMPRTAITSTTVSLPTGVLRLAFFEATKTETITKARIITGGSVPTGGTITLSRIGVYEVNDATGELALVASTANDSTLPAATSTRYEKTLSASFVKRAGRRYAVGWLCVYSGGSLQVPGNTLVGAVAGEAAVAPRLSAAISGLTDLPASHTLTSGNDSAAMPYLALVP